MGAWAGWVVRWEVKAGGVSGAGESEVRGGPCWVGGGGGTGGEGEREGEKEGEGESELEPSLVGEWEGEVGVPEGEGGWGGLS